MLNGLFKPFAMARMRLLALPVLGCGLVGGLAAGTPAMAAASSTIDQSLLAIEQVDARLAATPSMVAGVAKSAAGDGNEAAAEVEPILAKAVQAAFKPDGISETVSDAVAEADYATVDPAAFAKAAAAFAKARTKIDKAEAAQDATVAKDVEARLADAGAGPRIQRLADMMASPDLAVETAFTGQLMYVALEALVNSNAAEIASAPQEKLQADMAGMVEKLRSRSENEKPVPKDAAQTIEKSRLTFVLASMPDGDVSVLSDFYASAGGKAKRKALVETYKHAAAEANAKMLGSYFAALANYLKAHPDRQKSK